MEVKTSDFFVETLPTFSVSISRKRSNCENHLDYLKYMLLAWIDCIFLLIFVMSFWDFPPQKWLIHNDKDRGCHLHEWPDLPMKSILHPQKPRLTRKNNGSKNNSIISAHDLQKPISGNMQIYYQKKSNCYTTDLCGSRVIAIIQPLFIHFSSYLECWKFVLLFKLHYW